MYKVMIKIDKINFNTYKFTFFINKVLYIRYKIT